MTDSQVWDLKRILPVRVLGEERPLFLGILPSVYRTSVQINSRNHPHQSKKIILRTCLPHFALSFFSYEAAITIDTLIAVLLWREKYYCPYKRHIGPWYPWTEVLQKIQEIVGDCRNDDKSQRLSHLFLVIFLLRFAHHHVTLNRISRTSFTFFTSLYIPDLDSRRSQTPRTSIVGFFP